MKALLVRQGAIQFVGLATAPVLARLLTPRQFGLYALIATVASVLGLLGDLGLTARLVQRSEHPTNQDLDCAFTLQLLGFVPAFCLLAAVVELALPAAGLVGARALRWQIIVFASSLGYPIFRFAGVASMERELSYRWIAIAEVAEAITFQAVTLLLALHGFGVWSFVLAAQVRGAVGAGIMWIAAPYRPRPTVHLSGSRDLLRFGLIFQAGSVLNTVGGWATTYLVGGISGTAGLGLLGNASANARRPLNALVHPIARVSFPHMSRLQDRPDQLRDTIATYMIPMLYLVGLWSALLLAWATPLTRVVYGARWTPAAPAMRIYGIAGLSAVVCWVMGFAYASVNRNTTELRAVAAKTVMLFVLGVPLVFALGFTGMSVAALVAETVTACLLLMRFGGGLSRLIISHLLRSAVLVILSSGTSLMIIDHLVHGDVLVLVTGMILTTTLFALGALIAIPRSILSTVWNALNHRSISSEVVGT